jgi:mercuric ion binding protein
MKFIILVLALTMTQVLFAAENELKVGIKGMVCAFCAQGIEKKFKSQKEIESVQVSLADKTVKLKFKDGQKIPQDKIAEIIKDAGYEADFAK